MLVSTARRVTNGPNVAVCMGVERKRRNDEVISRRDFFELPERFRS
jgi:hypothetical protein